MLGERLFDDSEKEYDKLAFKKANVYFDHYYGNGPNGGGGLGLRTSTTATGMVQPAG